MHFTLIHGPLVGPSTWRAVAQLLIHAGHTVVVPDLRDAARNGPPFASRIAAACANPGDEPTTLAGHSRAGPHLPSIAAAIGRPVTALIYGDARRGSAAAVERVRDLARDGMLPPWHEWFPAGTLDASIPDPRWRSAFVAEVPTLKLEYFEEPLPPNLAMLSEPERVANALLDLATHS